MLSCVNHPTVNTYQLWSCHSLLCVFILCEDLRFEPFTRKFHIAKEKLIFIGVKLNLLEMPKKLSTNSKSVEAREKKAAQKKSATDKAAREAEDKLWEDDDKSLAKKKQKKEEEERKKAELLKKKAEKKALLEEEMASIKVTAKQSIQKITQAQIQAEVEKRNKVIESVNAPQKTVSLDKMFCKYSNGC